MKPAEARQRLEERRAQLLARIRKIETDIQRQGEERSAEIGEVAAMHENDEVLDQLNGVEREELAAIDAALERIALGTWGVCVRCGEPIEEARLEAMPWTPLCRKCASSS